jgi:hypothetical protein
MPEHLPAFLRPAEIDALLRLADAPRAWTPGRQGTGYDISSIKDLAPPDAPALAVPSAALAAPALAALSAATAATAALAPSTAASTAAGLPAIARAISHLGTPHEHYWDAYLIRYRDGAYVPPHVDPAQPGRRHRRLNAMLSQAAGGGELRIGGQLIALSPGDAVLFYSDQEVHEVAPVTGTRLLFSVGVWL